MYVRINGDPLEEVECFKYLGSQVAADGGCERDVVHRMNEGYKAWGVLKSELCRGLLTCSSSLIGVQRSTDLSVNK